MCRDQIIPTPPTPGWVQAVEYLDQETFEPLVAEFGKAGSQMAQTCVMEYILHRHCRQRSREGAAREPVLEGAPRQTESEQRPDPLMSDGMMRNSG